MRLSYFINFIVLWTLNLFDFIKCDALCYSHHGKSGKLCYGITAYCCGNHRDKCCWEKIWQVWYNTNLPLSFGGFWVIAFILIAAFIACCGYYCGNSEENRHRFLRSDSINMFRRFRRHSSLDISPLHQRWKPPELPPYTPTPSTSDRPQDYSTDPTPVQNMPYLEPPPPYTTVPTHPQPESNEVASLLPTAPIDSNSEWRLRNNNTTTTTTVSSR